MGEADVLIVHESALCRVYEVVEAGYGFPKMVGDSDQHHEDEREDEQGEPQEELVGFHEVLYAAVVGQCHADDESAVGLGEVEVFPAGGGRLPDIAPRGADKGFFYLGAAGVVVHSLRGDGVGVVINLALVAEDRKAKVAGHEADDAAELCAVGGNAVFLYRTGCEVGIAAEPRLEEFPAEFVFPDLLEDDENHGEQNEGGCEVQQKLAFV